MKLIHKPHQKDGWYEILPSEAQEILESQPRNRPLSETWASYIAEDINAGEYEMNGEPIIFDERGRLLDGQHRLRACVLANKPLRTYVVFNVPRRFFDTVDQGKKRSVGDVEAMAGTSRYHIAAAIVGHVIKHDLAGEQFGNIKQRRAVQPWMVRAFMRKNGALVNSTTEAVGAYQGKLGKTLPQSAVGFVYYIAAKDNKKKADEWLHSLATMEGLHNGSPVLAIRRRLQRAIERGEKIDTTERLALLAKTWVAHKSGTSISKLAWAKGERFPL